MAPSMEHIGSRCEFYKHMYLIERSHNDKGRVKVSLLVRGMTFSKDTHLGISGPEKRLR